jgi:hypothetical protein
MVFLIYLIISVHPQLGDRNRIDLGLHAAGGRTLTIDQVHIRMHDQARQELQKLERERFDSIRIRAGTYESEKDFEAAINYYVQAIPGLKVHVKQAMASPATSPVVDSDLEKEDDMIAIEQKRSDHQAWLRILHQFLFLAAQTYHRLEMIKVGFCFLTFRNPRHFI